MRNRVLATSLLASSITLASVPAQAVDVRIDGFGSLVYGQTLDKDEGTLLNNDGYDNRASYQSDSLYAVQVRADLGDGLAATTQILGKGSNNWEADIAWAYLTYQLSDSFSVKAGRQRLPYFLYSDFLDVGYAYHWIAPPTEVYDLGGFDNIDGVNLEYYGEWGDVVSRINLIVGASSINSSGLDVTSEDHWVVSWNMNWEWLTFQATYSESTTSIEGITAVGDGIASIWEGAITNPPLNALGLPALTTDQIDSLDMDNDRGIFAGVGVFADFGNWFAGAEFTDVSVKESPLNNGKESWYLTGGFRTGKFTFSLTYGYIENPANPDTIDTLTFEPSPFAPGVNPLSVLQGATASTDSFGAYSAEQLLNTVNEFYLLDVEAESYNFTMRWDFHPSAAYKFDVTQESADYKDISGDITTYEPILVRMGIDLVF